MKRRGQSDDDDPQQLQIDWTPTSVPATTERADPVSGPGVPVAEPSVPSAASAQKQANGTGLIQPLPWDFVTTFPDPNQEAVDNGVLGEFYEQPENIKLLHDAHASEALSALRALDKVLDARRWGVDPKTGRPPLTKEDQEGLPDFLQYEVERCERWWQTLMDTYEEAFGPEATDAFGKAIRARHAGIKVVLQDWPRPESSLVDVRSRVPATSTDNPAASSTTPNAGTELFQTKVACSKGRRIVARLPVPDPLPRAVAAGHFGQDEHGPVRPSADEVRDITENHAGKLAALLAEQRSGPKTEADHDRLSAEIQTAVQKYAEDFGDRAAEQLMAYAHRQMLLDTRAIRPNGRHR